jgi:hypothetical protein
MTSSLDTHCSRDNALAASPAFLLNHLTFGAPILEDDFYVATSACVGMIEAHSGGIP